MNTKKLYFTTGPSAIYYTLEDHVRSALRNQIPSIPHRSKQFSRIYQDADEKLRSLVGMPDDYCMFFTSSATEIWERTLQSVVNHKTLHLVNGAFSNRFYQIANRLGYQPSIKETALGEVVTTDKLVTDSEPELIGVTHNETSGGTQQPLEDLRILRKMFPSALITVDVVSSFPCVDLPFESIDSAYFSVQKCFGLPAGLGVWLVNKKTVERALKMAPTGRTSYHGIDSLWEKYQKFQTPNTPNVLAIYLLGKVIGDMLDKGIQRIRMESKYKSAILYNLLDSKTEIQPLVKNTDWRSETIVVGTSEAGTKPLIKSLYNQGMIIGAGYGDFKEKHIRIANFPTHSKEQIEMLVDKLDSLVG